MSIMVPNDKKKDIKHIWQYPHIRAIAFVILIYIVSGFLSVILYGCCEAIAAIFASICAGCVTGIVFYVITNIRNNEIQATKEEYKEADKYYHLASTIIRLCSDTISSISCSEEKIRDICSSSNDLLTYISTLCFDAPRTTRIIKDYTSEYNKTVDSAFEAIKTLEKNITDEKMEKQCQKALMDIMLFCEATKGILLKPWIQLMSEVSQFEKSRF